ncbi:TPA: site-2 protease family protein [candidate division CPR2 bacterium]|uniref:Peptidase M50 n=1 Tax=candidate division CPR2 bacterium GW2011_GWC1_41_48 TaxID=1618344 RepID=A0A0G0WB02_UNCC2|nr:MAG: Peptidase M50 [candidate division CPR2 bacterium GW2011_GWC2_39_35]KKR27279.1 MAG: Peptidase M50 [candidate division CPR2 bacterium GW2011_GWD2_39_7]KKR28164.1 MAG: Peptidase M50 [candidate division CPR2 bacterium GW2011_GWD1_39_7]KKS09247.1 MAG: Peptidase M50 [candidate division CPR2 bacterium GW2011_GWC1_41_48]OGB60313.1 MAG: hypothetical protein A2Y27_00485 [candidate division CPR2 bacterium GWD1_39_7]OGB70486.1 MAG: hypothetical protein A2Y26_03020 [candidate division CPR2 bacteriu
METTFASFLFKFLIMAVAFFVAITIHEFAHAWTANYLGDDTAKHHGRISLNPIVHFDPIGSSMILIGLLLQAPYVFGWGKPVPVNPNRFSNPKVGWALVSFAGPLANLVLVLFFSLAAKVSGNFAIASLLENFIWINIILAVFNLMPIPPLDGSKILYAFLPKNVDIYQLEAAGPFILLFLLFTGALHSIMWPVVTMVMSIVGIYSI